MFERQIDEFIHLSSDLVPGVFEKATAGRCEVHDFYAVVEFRLGESLDMDDVLCMMKDSIEITVMYVHRRSSSTDTGRSICAYSDHTFDDRFCIHAMTDGDGLVHSLTVTLFFSVDVMMEHLLYDLHQHSAIGSFDYSMEREEVMAAFC